MTVIHKVGSRRTFLPGGNGAVACGSPPGSFNGGMTEPPRSVKIGENERGGWSSDRPRRAGEAERPPRKVDVSVRGRVLAPTDRMRYSPGSLLLIACADPALRAKFTKRVIEEQSAVLSMDKLRALLKGRVPDADIEAKAQA